MQNNSGTGSATQINTEPHYSNMAGITTLLSDLMTYEWIIDSGASHYITPLRRLLTDIVEVDKQKNNGVQVLTGNKSTVTHTGSTIILRSCTLDNVLYVPDFKFSLLSVSKLTKELSCPVSFYPDLCLFQALSNGKVLGIGKEGNDLYWLQQ